MQLNVEFHDELARNKSQTDRQCQCLFILNYRNPERWKKKSYGSWGTSQICGTPLDSATDFKV